MHGCRHCERSEAVRNLFQSGLDSSSLTFLAMTVFVSTTAQWHNRYATRSEPRKPSTSDFSRLDCDDKPLAASRSSDVAVCASSEARVTLWIFSLTCLVPSAACCTLPAISLVAAPC